MLIGLCWDFDVYLGWLNMTVKFCFEILIDCWENCKKILKGLLFLSHPVYLHLKDGLEMEITAY